MPPSELSDEALIARVCRRDVAAFGVLYDRYARAVYALAACMLGRAEAEEVVQEVFLRLWSKADQFRAERGPFRAWFMTIARHQVWDALRHLGQEQSVTAEAIDQMMANQPENYWRPTRWAYSTPKSRQRSNGI